MRSLTAIAALAVFLIVAEAPLRELLHCFAPEELSSSA